MVRFINILLGYVLVASQITALQYPCFDLFFTHWVLSFGAGKHAHSGWGKPHVRVTRANANCAGGAPQSTNSTWFLHHVDSQEEGDGPQRKSASAMSDCGIHSVEPRP
jgi:hypothetical protein